MEWFEPWWSTDDQDDHFHETFRNQLRLEVGPAHPMFGLPTRLIGRGNGDDALFKILDGSGLVAVVHLTWARSREEPPWPCTTIYPSMQAFIEDRMRPEHDEWLADQD